MNKEKLAFFHRENILNAADLLFLSLGYEKTTVELIAKKSTYSKPTLYAYFESKEEIFAFILQKYMQKFRDEIEKAFDKENILQSYLDMCLKVYQLKEDASAYFDGIMGNIDFRGNIDEELAKILESLANLINAKLFELLQIAEAQGLISKQTDEKFAYDYVWSCVLGIVSSGRFAFAKMKDKEEKNRKLEKCFESVLRSLK